MHEHMSQDLQRFKTVRFWKIQAKDPVQINCEDAPDGIISQEHQYIDHN